MNENDKPAYPPQPWPTYPQQEVCNYLHLLAIARMSCERATKTVGDDAAKALEAHAKIPARWRAFVCEPSTGLAAASQEFIASVCRKESKG
jgi:hypothetical protein